MGDGEIGDGRRVKGKGRGIGKALGDGTYWYR